MSSPTKQSQEACLKSYSKSAILVWKYHFDVNFHFQVSFKDKHFLEIQSSCYWSWSMDTQHMDNVRRSVFYCVVVVVGVCVCGGAAHGGQFGWLSVKAETVKSSLLWYQLEMDQLVVLTVTWILRKSPEKVGVSMSVLVWGGSRMSLPETSGRLGGSPPPGMEPKRTPLLSSQIWLRSFCSRAEIIIIHF